MSNEKQVTKDTPPTFLFHTDEDKGVPPMNSILFYAALWTQGNGGAMLAGAGSACVALAVIAWVILRYSRRLPISQFFAWSSLLIAALAVVLAGKGFAALQEAGYKAPQIAKWTPKQRAEFPSEVIHPQG